METVLLIDDDRVLLELLSDHLTQAGYNPLTADSGREGLRLAEEARVDLVVLDVMMPALDGWEVCQRLKAAFPSLPIIMLSAKDQEIDKLRGFHLGVDDYVTKPFSFAELVARTSAVLTRTRRQPQPSHRVVSGDLTIDIDHRRVTLSGKMVDLTPTEYRLLETLARHIHRPVPVDFLLKEVWGPEYVGEADHVKRYIWALRQKIEADPGFPKHILTERGFGYRFE